MDEQWKIQLLGGLRATHGDRVVTRFRSQKTAGLLAYLAYNLHRSHPREVLIERFWPESDVRAGRHSLSQSLSSLRHQLEPPGIPAGAVIVANRTSVRLNPAAVTTDVAEFETALQAAAQARGTMERAHFLGQAVEIYEGELLPGYFEDWILMEQQRLAESYFQSLLQVVAHREQAGDLPQAIQYACRAVAADPLREEAHQHLIRLYVAGGQSAAALQQYRELERLLREDLGQDPSPATRALADQIVSSGVQAESGVQVFRSSGVQEGGVPGSGRVGPSRTLEPPSSKEPEHLNTRTPEHLNTPVGTVTFLLSDIEDSTGLWERTGAAYEAARSRHHTLLRKEFLRHRGHEVKEMGDGFMVVFASAGDALACAVAGQRALAAETWPVEVGTLKVRMALHTGDVRVEEGEYRGLLLHHASRMVVAAHGGQILCSEITAGLIRRGSPGDLGPGVHLAELGVYRLRGVSTPERLFQVAYPDMPRREFPALKAGVGQASNLPLQFTRFFGREEELARLRSTLLDPAAGCRLLTLTGPGGTGKTRLALELAGRLIEPLSDAVWFVPLADVSAPERILDAVRGALRLARSPTVEPLDQVVEALSFQPGLLVLDNFEHLLGGFSGEAQRSGAGIVRTLLERVSTLKCLVTSRQRLNVTGEREFVVSPLPTPAMRIEDSGSGIEGAERRAQPSTLDPQPFSPEALMKFPSAQLFVDRSQAVRPDFQATPGNAAAVAALCTRLEGIPLAIVLAAARVQALTPAQILNHLQRRSDFLVSRQRDIEGRHRTLRATVDWSYRLLSPELQRFFAGLSVFRGGWTLEAAEAVCVDAGPGLSTPDVLDYLEPLRECSLVTAEEVGEEVRYRLLETLRTYGWDRLQEMGEADLRCRRHRDWYLALAERFETLTHGPDQRLLLDRLETEHDNLRAALDWCRTDADVEAELRMAGALWKFWFGHGHLREGRQRLMEALDRRRGASAPARLKALLGAGALAFYQGDFAAAAGWAEESLRLARVQEDRRSIALALTTLGSVASFRGEYGPATSLFEESLGLCQEEGDTWGTALALHQLGVVARHEGRVDAASRHLSASLTLFRQSGDTWGTSLALETLGDLMLQTEEHDQATILYREVLALSQQLRHTTGIAGTLCNLGLIAARQGEHDRAVDLLTESLTLHRGIGSQHGMVECFEALAEVAGRQGHAARAARLYGAAGALREALGAAIQRSGRAAYEARLAAERAALGEDAFAAAWAEGRAMTLDGTLAYALEATGS